jgi:hypothetical protein
MVADAQELVTKGLVLLASPLAQVLSLVGDVIFDVAENGLLIFFAE